MKELQKLNSLQAQEINSQDEELKQTHLSHFDLKPGHRLWEINVMTGECTEAKYRQVAVRFTGTPVKGLMQPMEGTLSKKMELDQKPDCVYFAALNKKNALRKYQGALKRATEE